MVGLRQSRSVQDEKLVEAIFTSERDETSTTTGMQNRNLIIDARPTANAMANVAMGAGSENTENYRKCRKLYLGIDNIHVMRDSLNKIADGKYNNHKIVIVVMVDRVGYQIMSNSYGLCIYVILMIVYVYRYRKQYSNIILCDSMLDCSCCCLAWMWSRPLCRSLIRHYRKLLGHKAISSTDTSGIVSKIQLSKSNWLHHIQLLLDGVSNIVRTVHYDRAHVLVHCSDGWDRTAQLTALASLCLDPYYRTLEGFAVLVEKEWCSFGHKFTDRCGHLTHERDFQIAAGAQASAAEATLSSIQTRLHQQSSHVRESSPVFHQFLDCCYQLWTQAPWRFEFNERFLIALHYHAYACQFGTFLCNTERERYELARDHTYSVWPHLDLRRNEFLNDIYDATRDQEIEEGIIIPDTNYLKYWASLFARRDEEVNGGLTDEIALTEPVRQRSTAAAATASMAKSAAAAMAGVVSAFSNGLSTNPLIPTNDPPATESTVTTASIIVKSSVEETTSTGAVSPTQAHRLSLASNGNNNNNNETSTADEDAIIEQMSTVNLITHPLAEPSTQERLPYARDPFVADILFASSRPTKSPSTSSHTANHPYDTKSKKVTNATSHCYNPLEENPWL
jgi:hypothetical protein